MLVWLTLFASLFAAVVVSAVISARAAKEGRSLRWEWFRRSAYGALAMVAVWAAYFVVGNVAELFAR